MDSAAPPGLVQRIVRARDASSSVVVPRPGSGAIPFPMRQRVIIEEDDLISYFIGHPMKEETLI